VTTVGPVGKLMRAYYDVLEMPMTLTDRIDCAVCWGQLQKTLDMRGSNGHPTINVSDH
jgi:hypothetical protein